MHRLQYETGHNYRPCDYFDLIVAVDTSAYACAIFLITIYNLMDLCRPLAVFLGIFGMTVDEALDAFFVLYTSVFVDENASSDTRATKMEVAIKELMESEKYNLSPSAKLSDAIFQTNSCKV